MKISGFTIIKNAIKYDFPFVESVKSILPVCDEFIITHGDSDDNTKELIDSIGSAKIKAVNTVWDSNLRENGLILSQQTDLALSHTTGDWCFYIQADELVHEQYLPVIKNAMIENLDNKNVEGLLFKYLHFFGSYDYITSSRQWYRHEIRIIRNNIGVHSYKDAQGFRRNGKKLFVKHVDAYIYHYGWVRPPQIMQKKIRYFHSIWHSEEWIKKNVPQVNEFDYSQTDYLKPFTSTHPEVMKERIKKQNITFKYNPSKLKKGFIRTALDWIEKWTGWRIGEYKNHIIIK